MVIFLLVFVLDCTRQGSTVVNPCNVESNLSRKDAQSSDTVNTDRATILNRGQGTYEMGLHIHPASDAHIGTRTRPMFPVCTAALLRVTSASLLPISLTDAGTVLLDSVPADFISNETPSNQRDTEP